MTAVFLIMAVFALISMSYIVYTQREPDEPRLVSTRPKNSNWVWFPFRLRSLSSSSGHSLACLGLNPRFFKVLRLLCTVNAPYGASSDGGEASRLQPAIFQSCARTTVGVFWSCPFSSNQLERALYFAVPTDSMQEAG